MPEPTSPPEHTTVSMTLGMSLDTFRPLQEKFIRDLAELLGIQSDKIQIRSIYASSTETIHPDFINAAQLRALGQRGLEY